MSIVPIAALVVALGGFAYFNRIPRKTKKRNKGDLGGDGQLHSSHRKALRGVRSGSIKGLAILFYADWCPNCTQTRVAYDKVAREDSGAVIYLRCDVDREQLSGGTNLLETYAVDSVPTVVLLHADGVVRMPQTGEMETTFAACIQKLTR